MILEFIETFFRAVSRAAGEAILLALAILLTGGFIGYQLGHQRGYRVAVEELSGRVETLAKNVACQAVDTRVSCTSAECPPCPGVAGSFKFPDAPTQPQANPPARRNAGASFTGVPLSECGRLCDFNIATFSDGNCVCRAEK